MNYGRPSINPRHQPPNLAGFNMNAGQFRQERPNFDPRRMQSVPKDSVIDIGYYVPPLLKDTDKAMPPAADVEASYQRGSTVIRQHNNTTIDNYYKKFAATNLEYHAESPDAEPTVIYQDLDAEAKKTATATTEKTTVKGETRVD
jgi:hypothetical protein